MVRKIVFTLIWTVAFFFGAAILLGFATGLYLGLRFVWDGSQPGENFITAMGKAWVFVPMAMCPIGFLLGIFGVLPGTRMKRKDLVNDVSA